MGLRIRVVSGAIAAALVVATPFVAKWEGLRTEPYADLGGVQTVCYGETRVPMKGYTPAECRLMLEKALRDYYLPEVLKCSPTLVEKPVILAMAGSLGYNIGTSLYCSSSAAKHFQARRWEQGCRAMILYDKVTYGRPQKGKVCVQRKDGRFACQENGLVNRRQDELKKCLTAI